MNIHKPSFSLHKNKNSDCWATRYTCFTIAWLFETLSNVIMTLIDVTSIASLQFVIFTSSFKFEIMKPNVTNVNETVNSNAMSVDRSRHRDARKSTCVSKRVIVPARTLLAFAWCYTCTFSLIGEVQHKSAYALMEMLLAAHARRSTKGLHLLQSLKSASYHLKGQLANGFDFFCFKEKEEKSRSDCY